MTSPDNGKQPEVGAGGRSRTQRDVDATLPAAMTGRASPAKAAVGDKPVFAYISSLPQPQRSIAERVDALAAETLPGLQRSVKWGMAWYGVGDGWCFSCGGFAGHVKLTFGRGTSLTPVPPVTPIGMGKTSRGVDLEFAGRPGRTPSRVVDDTGRGDPRVRETMSPLDHLRAVSATATEARDPARMPARSPPRVRSDPLTPRPCGSARTRGGRPRGGRPPEARRDASSSRRPR